MYVVERLALVGNIGLELFGARGYYHEDARSTIEILGIEYLSRW